MKETSKLANVKKDKATDQELIVGLLAKNPEKDFTYKEIARGLAWWDDPNRASRRMKELVTLKKIKELDPRMCFIAKSKCTVYQILN